MKKIAFALAASGLALFITLVAAELLVRLVVPKSVWSASISSLMWQEDSRLGWTQRPNLDLAVVTEQGRSRFRTNGDGLRPADAQREKTAKPRILLVGDSTVVGLGVAEEFTLHRQLERALGALGVEAEVFSAGVEGHSTDQTLLRTEDLLVQYAPDVVIHSVCSNDFSVLDRNTGYLRSKPRFRIVDDALVHEPPDMNRKPGVTFVEDLASRSALLGYLRPGLLRLRAFSDYWLKKHPERWGNELYFDHRAWSDVNLDLFGRLLAEMEQRATQRGAAFLVYVHPDALSVWEPLLNDFVKQTGFAKDAFDPYAIEGVVRGITVGEQLRFVPMIRNYRGRQDIGPFHLLPRDPHSNAAGHRIIAETLARELVDSETLKPEPTP